MSERLKKFAPLLRQLHKAKPKRRNELIKQCTDKDLDELSLRMCKQRYKRQCAPNAVTKGTAL